MSIASCPWKLNAPLRLVGSILLKFKNKMNLSPYSLFRKILLVCFGFFSKFPKVKSFLIILLKPFPKIDSMLRNTIKDQSKPLKIGVYANDDSTSIDSLSPGAQKIYSDLKKAIEEKQKENNE